jgi:hypothetical protein
MLRETQSIIKTNDLFLKLAKFVGGDDRLGVQKIIKRFITQEIILRLFGGNFLTRELEISDQFEGLSKSQQIELADKLGVRDSKKDSNLCFSKDFNQLGDGGFCYDHCIYF